ncbi:ComEC/Rec2 family competence protein [Saccharomonospora glauca]|uniref:ComEC/Rec2-related protein n=1 Tax=Saccharomonospora glauca K62 TaxID=928724 RepID=I1D036_9PSEU|nr:ComEC/Rec2 family competence protein [Saccharomonospora glauca]EIE98310.1 ComEC/Rec2-related protein [Saccharomonospora glauca K62]
MVLRVTGHPTPVEAGRHDWRLVPAAVTVWAGTAAGLLWGWWACPVCGVVAGAGAVRLWRWASRGDRDRRRWRPAAGVLLVCGLLTVWPTTARLYAAEHDPLRERARRGDEVSLTAVVAQRPRPVHTSGYGARPGGVRSVLVPVDVVAASSGGEEIPSAGRVLFVGDAKFWSDVRVGQWVRVRAELAPARPHEMTVAVGYVREPPEPEGEPPWWQRAAEELREKFRAVSGVLGEEPAGLLPGLVVGDTSALPERVEREFLTSGMSHLTAVSGSNVAIVCGAVLVVARMSRCGPRTSAVLAGLALVGFVVLVGYEPSVLRAGVMGAVALLALVLGRRGSALPALAAAVCVLGLADPEMAVSMGFVLSVVATAGLVLVAPRWSRALVRRGLPEGVADAVVVPTVAFLVTAPVIAGMAGEVSLVSVGANLLAAPVVAPVTVLGALAAVLAPWWPDAAELVVHVVGPGVQWLILVARHAAAIPGAVLHWPSGWWGAGLAALAVAVVVCGVRYRRTRSLLVLVVVVVVALTVSTRVWAPGWPPDRWVLVACDVGQGDGLVLATGEPGRVVVVDTGPDPALLDRCLDRLDVERVPLVVLTHLHADHVGGLASVFDGRAVGAVAVGPGRSPAWAWDDVLRVTTARGVPMVELTAGDRLTWPELRLDVLAPTAPVAPPTEDADGTAVNNGSVVLRATTPAGRVLLTGDVELAAQADLLAAGEDLRADVLKVPHHGSRYTLPTFLTAVSPRVAVTSVGADNSYGHPSSVTLRALAEAGALVARTDTGGDTAVVLDEGELAVVARGAAPRRRPCRSGGLSRRARPARPPPTAARWPWGRRGRRGRRGSSVRLR